MARILALDFGLRRIGAAIGDTEVSIACPLETYTRTTAANDEAHYARLIREERIDVIVVGLPLHNNGGESAISFQAREFGQWLSKLTSRPVRYRDERYTSALANELLSEHEVKPRRRKGKLDRLAAQMILQSYFDAGCPEDEAPARPITDGPQRR
jgi:putative Holliday junction resolvase